MRLLDDPARPFTHVSPIYNWIYPFSSTGVPLRHSGKQIADVINRGSPGERPRALYLHVPFCQTICTFCPLLKGPLPNSEVLDVYVQALLAEIACKASDRELTRLPIRAVFFGGGTPSLLSPQHIAAIGQALHAAFDLSAVEEFSVEMEVKSITPPLLEAFAKIGVTHARFGLQTFSARHRAALNLTATVKQVHDAATLLPRYFPHVSCDVLYGFHGQTADEFFHDIESAVELGLNNLDFYPLNTLVVQRRMHTTYQRLGLRPISAMSKLYMHRVLRAAMNTFSFLPHNGHGYVKVNDTYLGPRTVVTNAYSFKYHKHVYGSSKDEFIGLGNGALSYLSGHTIANVASRERYIQSLLKNEDYTVKIKRHAEHVNAAKSIAISLPYLGLVKRSEIQWDALPAYSIERLQDLERRGLLVVDGDVIRLTLEGWFWYPNLMFYLSPTEEQAYLSKIMIDAEERRMESGALDLMTAAT